MLTRVSGENGALNHGPTAHQNARWMALKFFALKAGKLLKSTYFNDMEPCSHGFLRAKYRMGPAEVMLFGLYMISKIRILFSKIRKVRHNAQKL